MKTLWYILWLMLTCTTAFAENSTKAGGQSLPASGIVILLVLLYIVSRVFAAPARKKPCPPPPEQPSLEELAHKHVGELKRLNKQNKRGMRLLSSKNDVETWLVLEERDVSATRQNEREKWQPKVKMLSAAVVALLLAVLYLLVFGKDVS